MKERVHLVVEVEAVVVEGGEGLEVYLGMVLCLPSMRMVVGIGIVDMLGGGVEAEVVVSVAVEEVGITALRLMLSRIWEATIRTLHFKAAVVVVGGEIVEGVVVLDLMGRSMQLPEALNSLP